MLAHIVHHRGLQTAEAEVEVALQLRRVAVGVRQARAREGHRAIVPAALAMGERERASGTALLDVRKRQWSAAALKAIDAPLAEKLPRLISSDELAGILQAAGRAAASS